MGDKKTREKIADVLVEECPIRAIHRKERKPLDCVKFGPSNSCDTCTHAWASIADDVIVMVGNRMKNVETEREKRMEAERSRDKLIEAVQEGITRQEEAFSDVIDLINESEEEDDR